MITTVSAPTTRSNVTLHPVVRDVVFSGVTSLVISGSALLVVSLIGRLSDPEAVAEYLLMRRVSGWILSGVLLGITLALPRYIANAVNRPGLQRAYFSVGFYLAIAATAAVAIITCLSSGAFARLLFGDRAFEALILPLALLLLANAFHATVFGYYRGRLEMERANLLQFLNFGVFPIVSVSVFWVRQSVGLMFVLLAGLMFVSTTLIAIPIFRENSEHTMSWRILAGNLLRYGTARIPGDIALGALFTIAPVIASHYIPLPKLAPLLLGLGILSVLGTGANPLNQVLLSKITMMLAEDRTREARRYIQHLLSASIEISFFICVQAVIFADVAVRIWVGPKYLTEILLIRILLAAAPFYLLHTALRCVIDAASVTAYNTRNILAAFGIFMAAMFGAVWTLPEAVLLNTIATIFLFALVVLGWLTARTLNQLYEVCFSWRDSGPCLALSATLGVVSFVFRLLEGFHTPALQACAAQVLLTGVFVLFLSRSGSPWFSFLREAISQKRTPQTAEPALLLKSA